MSIGPHYSHSIIPLRLYLIRVHILRHFSLIKYLFPAEFIHTKRAIAFHPQIKSPDFLFFPSLIPHYHQRRPRLVPHVRRLLPSFLQGLQLLDDVRRQGGVQLSYGVVIWKDQDCRGTQITVF